MRPTAKRRSHLLKAAYASLERRRIFCALTSNHGGVHLPMVGRSHLYASGAYSDSLENNTGRSFPQCRLDAWQRPGNLRQAGYIHISYELLSASVKVTARHPPY